MTNSNRLKRRWMSTAAACLLIGAGVGVALAQQGGGPGSTDHGGMSMEGPGSSGQGGMDHGGMDHGGMGHGGMGHGGMGHSGMMGHGGMMGGGMDHGATGGGMGRGGMMGGAMDHGAMGGKDGGHGGMMMGQMMCRTTEHIEGRLAYLKAELKLADVQTAQWNAFADAFRSAAQKAGQFCASMHEHEGSESSGMSGGVLQQLGMMERMMTAHLEEVRAIKAAAEPLFNVLSDEQKKIADQTMTGIMGLGMGMKGGMGMMGGMMGGMGKM